MNPTPLLVVAGALGLAWLAYRPDLPRDALERAYAAEDEFRVVAGVRVRVREGGDPSGPAVLLIHGFGASLETWDAWAGELAPLRVLRFDLPGFGLTGPDPTGDYSEARAIEVILALMDALGIERAAVVGHSIGGRIAWRLAADHPSRVTRLVLVSPAGFASPGFEYGKVTRPPAPFRLMRYALPKAFLRANLRPGYADPRAMTRPLVDRYYDLLLAPGVRGAILDRMAQTRLEDPVPFLRRVEAPTLLVWGERDAMIPFANSADYVRALRDVELVALPDVGHLPQEERPHASAPRVLAFLLRGPGSPPREPVGAAGLAPSGPLD